MRTVTKDTLTQAFLDCCDPDTDPRLHHVLERLVHHLHAFAREVDLTHDEWRTGLRLLTEAAAFTTPERNEFVLFSDVLGLSSLVDMINTPDAATSSSVLGPFHILGAPPLPVGGDLKGDNVGDTVVVEGQVLDTAGRPIPGAMLELWQTAANGLYSNQDEAQSDWNLRGCMTLGDDGRYLFSTVRPIAYTVPDDGPVGALLHATGRHPWRPGHHHVIVQAEGFQPLVTELFPDDDPYLDEDAVFGVRSDLVIHYTRTEERTALPPDLLAAATLEPPFHLVRFDFKLQAEA